jgi:hypothetical protein
VSDQSLYFLLGARKEYGLSVAFAGLMCFWSNGAARSVGINHTWCTVQTSHISLLSDVGSVTLVLTSQGLKDKRSSGVSFPREHVGGHADCGTAAFPVSLHTLNSVASLREWTIPIERPPLVGDVSANFCWSTWTAWRIPTAVFLVLFYQVAPRLYSRGWVNSVPDSLLLRKSGSRESNPDLWVWNVEL